MTRLGQYLLYAIHGKKLRIRRKARRGPARSWKYKAWIRSLPCAACGTEYRVEAAHTGSDGGVSMKASDYSCIPLCSMHHTLDTKRSYHSLGRDGFERYHSIDCAGLVKRLNSLWFEGKRQAA